jgi:hypothetical protein
VECGDASACTVGCKGGTTKTCEAGTTCTNLCVDGG